MDKLKTYDLMAKISRELDDLRKSQQAVLEKIGKVEVDNLELGDKSIENSIPEIYSDTAEAAEAIKKIWESFSSKTEGYARKNNISKLREQEEITKRK